MARSRMLFKWWNADQDDAGERGKGGAMITTWIVAAAATLMVIVVGGAFLYRHLQHRKLGIISVSKLPPPMLIEPAPIDDAGVDLDKLRHACEYAERLRSMGVDDASIRERLSTAGQWPESYIKIALK